MDANSKKYKQIHQLYLAIYLMPEQALLAKYHELRRLRITIQEKLGQGDHNNQTASPTPSHSTAQMLIEQEAAQLSRLARYYPTEYTKHYNKSASTLRAYNKLINNLIDIRSSCKAYCESRFAIESSERKTLASNVYQHTQVFNRLAHNPLIKKLQKKDNMVQSILRTLIHILHPEKREHYRKEQARKGHLANSFLTIKQHTNQISMKKGTPEETAQTKKQHPKG